MLCSQSAVCGEVTAAAVFVGGVAACSCSCCDFEDMTAREAVAWAMFLFRHETYRFVLTVVNGLYIGVILCTLVQEGQACRGEYASKNKVSLVFTVCNFIGRRARMAVGFVYIIAVGFPSIVLKKKKIRCRLRSIYHAFLSFFF